MHVVRKRRHTASVDLLREHHRRNCVETAWMLDTFLWTRTRQLSNITMWLAVPSTKNFNWPAKSLSAALLT